ncbi:MAG: hypothetical protein GY699_21270 [Desulfobacteraceae bacterium]|nr:hypothetical protein [Desulfobacteraceae bacterium]
MALSVKISPDSKKIFRNRRCIRLFLRFP